MSVDIFGDQSWTEARDLAKSSLDPQPALVRLIRSAWTDQSDAKDFIKIVNAASVPHSALIQAARNLTPGIENVEQSVKTLGFKGAATIAAICFTCNSINRRCTSERSKTAITQHVIDSVEIGYHFGISAESVGPETGMLLGFARSLGPALVLASSDSSLNEARTILDDCREPKEYISQFGCEPYQVASLALQRLGFGPIVSSAAVMALGNLNHQPISTDPNFLNWWAASEWIDALARGAFTPKRKRSTNQFPDLINLLPPETDPPLHLQALYSSIDLVRSKHSSWSWHLVEPIGQNSQQSVISSPPNTPRT